MTYPPPARTTARRIPGILVVGLLIVSAGIAAALGSPLLTPSSSTATSPVGAPSRSSGVAAVAKLDPALRAALRRAAMAAAEDGVTFVVNSGWRSPAYQEQLLKEAISKYGSMQEAARWVATPKTSAHVSGDAVDLEPAEATTWLSKHGARYGLCQIYRNEPWHYELRPKAIGHGCPPMYADPTHDPRMNPSRPRG